MGWQDASDDLGPGIAGGYEGWEQLPGWTQAHQGLNLYYRGLLWAVVTVVGVAVTGFVAAAVGLVAVGRVLWVAIPFATMAVQVVLIVGILKFTSVPERSGARTLAWLALVGMGLGVAVSLVDFIGSVGELLDPPRRGYLGGSRREPPSTIEQLASLASAVGFVCFVLACRRVAGFIGSVGIRGALNAVLGLFGAFAVWTVAVLVAPELGRQFILGVALLVGVFVASLIFLFNVGSLRDAIFVGVEASTETDAS